jgi:hypothetical protein
MINRIPRFFSTLLTLLLALYFIPLGLLVRPLGTNPYSLAVKRELIRHLKSLGYPLEIRFSLPRERNTAFDYIMQQERLVSDPKAERKAYIYEANNLEIIAPEEARSIILEQPIKAFKLIVFSN